MIFQLESGQQTKKYATTCSVNEIASRSSANDGAVLLGMHSPLRTAGAPVRPSTN
jgi:hypothetical protein